MKKDIGLSQIYETLVNVFMIIAFFIGLMKSHAFQVECDKSVKIAGRYLR